MSGVARHEPGERLPPLGVPRELIEARATRREQDHVPARVSASASATASPSSATSREISPHPASRRYSKMPGPDSPWQRIARQRSRCGSISAKSVSFSDPPRMSTTGLSKLARAAATAAGLVALESSTYSTPARSATTSIRCGLSR